MLMWSWEAASAEAIMGDDDALALLDDDSRAVVIRARHLYRDGRTEDADIAAVLAAVTYRPGIRLH